MNLRSISKFLLLNRIKKLFSKLKFRRFYTFTARYTRSHPFLSLLFALFLLFILILLGNILTPKQNQVSKSQTAKPVQIYSIGKAPTILVNAKIEKSGVIKITAQTAGVVQDINVNEGDSVSAGTQIANLSTNYQGGNVPALQTQLAQDQLQNAISTYPEQQAIIQKQKDIASKTDENATDLRNIQNQSIAETQSLLDLNNQILQTLQNNLTNDPNNLSDKELVAQYQNSVNSLNESLRNLNYQSSNSNPPAQLADIQRDLTLQQLDIQQKSLDLAKEMDQVQVNIAAANEAMMYPATPISGTVEKIYVRVGQALTPGAIIAEISGDTQTVTAVASVAQNIANRITNVEPSTLIFNNTTYKEMPLFITDESTDNQLFDLTYQVPDQLQRSVSDGQYIQISLPVGSPSTSSSDPFVPIDAIFQTQSTSYLFIDVNGRAKAQEVTLGQVFGKYTEVLQGLKDGDQVILDRNIIAGDKVVPLH